MEPLRPWFLAFTVLLLSFGFYRAYRPASATTLFHVEGMTCGGCE
jgi:hypothetical protein